MEHREELFNELDVHELEDRLELVSRCLCRNGGDGGDGNGGTGGDGGGGGEADVDATITPTGE